MVLTLPDTLTDWNTDECVTGWLSHVAPRTKENYINRFPSWLLFIQMSPHEQLDKRHVDLQSFDLRERDFFESKLKDYKQMLIAKGYRASTVISQLVAVLSFFSHNKTPLKFTRGDLYVKEDKQRLLDEWVLTLDEIRMLYQNAGCARDKAILLFMYHTGFAPADICVLNIEDFRFYDELGQWKLNPAEHYYIGKPREKTGVIQQTCVSSECMEEIKASLEQRGYPKTGPLFISIHGNGLTPRDINDIIKRIVAITFRSRLTEWVTYRLRDSYMNALERAKLAQEMKDLMVGHQRQGARGNYQVTGETIKELYASAFPFMSVKVFFNSNGEALKHENEQLKKKVEELLVENTILKGLLQKDSNLTTVLKNIVSGNNTSSNKLEFGIHVP